MDVAISPRRVLWALLITATMLVLISFAGQFLHHIFGLDSAGTWVDMVNVDIEANVPTWFAVLLLAVATFVLSATSLAVARSDRAYLVHWVFLTVMFGLFSLDEAAQVHERAIALRNYLDVGGPLTFAWVIPATVLVVVVGAAYVPFVLRLPSRTRSLVVVAAFIYVTGALGLEFLEGAIAGGRGEDNMVYEVVATVQEAMEFVGVILFIYALLGYLHLRAPRWQITVEAG